jgi:hypothetical protein
LDKRTLLEYSQRFRLEVRAEKALRPTKAELCRAVTEHFANLSVDPGEAIDDFLTTLRRSRKIESKLRHQQQEQASKRKR